LFLVLGFGMFALLGMQGVQAIPSDDLPEGLNRALFGGSNLYAAKMILAGSILASLGLALSMAKMNVMGTIIVLLSTAGVEAAIGWLPMWVLYLVAMVIVAMFSKSMADWVTGNKSGS